MSTWQPWNVYSNTEWNFQVFLLQKSLKGENNLYLVIEEWQKFPLPTPKLEERPNLAPPQAKNGSRSSSWTAGCITPRNWKRQKCFIIQPPEPFKVHAPYSQPSSHDNKNRRPTYIPQTNPVTCCKSLKKEEKPFYL